MQTSIPARSEIMQLVAKNSTFANGRMTFQGHLGSRIRQENVSVLNKLLHAMQSTQKT